MRETTTMTLERNLRTCKAVCDSVGIPYQEVVNIKANDKAVRRLGMCTRVKAHKFEIEISSRLLEQNVSQLMLMNVMLHELLHTCEGCMNHGRKWKWYAAKLNAIGYDIETYTTAEERAVTQRDSDFRYKITCEGCGETWRYMRRGSAVRSLQRDSHSCRCHCGCYNLRLEILA